MRVALAVPRQPVPGTGSAGTRLAPRAAAAARAASGPGAADARRGGAMRSDAAAALAGLPA